MYGLLTASVLKTVVTMGPVAQASPLRHNWHCATVGAVFSVPGPSTSVHPPNCPSSRQSSNGAKRNSTRQVMRRQPRIAQLCRWPWLQRCARPEWREKFPCRRSLSCAAHVGARTDDMDHDLRYVDEDLGILLSFVIGIVAMGLMKFVKGTALTELAA